MSVIPDQDRNYALLAAGIAGVFFVVAEPIPQDPNYHLFADTRQLLGVPNFFNVVSNIAFLIVGLSGLRVTGFAREHLAYIVLFAGLILTAFGSAWYHAEPNNETLFWDRLPMTVSFAGLVAAVAREYFSRRLEQPVLIGMLLLGAASVVYWAWSEARGMGDLRPYAVVAILPILIVPLILVVRADRSPMTPWFWAMIALYVPAKLFEFFDYGTFAGEVISGHSLKHVFAALSAGALAVGLWRRQS